MALAVAEAERVLRPHGRLVDLHPEDRPARLEIWTPVAATAEDDFDPQGYERRALGDFQPDEMLDYFKAATEAMARAEPQRLVRRASERFEFLNFFDSLDDLTDYLEDNDEMDLAGDDLLEQALLALQAAPPGAKLVIAQPVLVTVLEKT